MTVRVDTVLWDADGVLQRAPGGREETMRPAIKGLVDDEEAFLAEALREERHALTGDVRWREVLPQLLQRWGMADALDDLLAAWLTIEPVAASRAVVRRLREAGIGCYLASNQDEQRSGYMQTELGYATLLDGAFYSHELRAAKPDPAFFTSVLTRLGREPAQVALVDDNADHVAAARTLGLRAVRWSASDDIALLRAELAELGLPHSGVGGGS